MIVRALVVAALVAGAGLFVHARSGSEIAVARQTLDQLPMQMDGWRGEQAAPFADDVVAQLGVDDYIHRRYRREGHGAPIAVYVGYYRSQRQGDTIHSPQNCLPGAGWQPIESGTATIPGASGATVNRYVIAKGLDRQVVLYWYQGRGRVVANEYANKGLLMFDAARLRRTNGGLVRLIAPVVSTTAEASDQATAFAATLLPRLARHLP